jgi:hypothetical protein
MALQLGALRDALLDAGAAPEKADQAAEELAAYESRFASIETRLASIEGKLTGLTWAVGLNVAASVALFGMLFTAVSRLGEISGQVAQIARAIH